MDRLSFDALLSSEHLGLKREESTYHASEDAPLTIFAGARGGDAMRLTKVEAIVLDEALLAQGMVGLKRERAFTVIELAMIFAVERDLSESERDRRRTGFL